MPDPLHIVPGYFWAIMAEFSDWNRDHLHSQMYLLSDSLQKMFANTLSPISTYNDV